MQNSDQDTVLLPKIRFPDLDEDGDGDERPDAWSAPDGEGPARRALTTVAWLLPMLAMAALGMVRLTWSSLSADELGYWAFVTTPWDEALDLLGELDSGTVPYHVALKAYAMAAGTSDLALRAPSALFMALAAALVAGLGARLTRPRTGFTAGILFVIVPGVTRFGQEIGPTAAAAFLTALSTLLLVLVLDRGTGWRYTGYAFTVLLLGLTLPVALLVLAGHGFAVLMMRRRALLGWLLATVLGLVPAIGSIVYLGLPTVRIGLDTSTELLDVTTVASALFGTALVGGALVGLGLISVSFRKPSVIYSCWAVIPVVLLYALSRVGLSWEAPALAFTLGGWALLGAHALHRAPVVRGVAAGLILAAFCVPSQIAVRQRDGHGLASAELGAIITGQALRGDVAVYGPGPKSGAVGRDVVARYVPADIRPADVLALTPPRTDGRIVVDECADVARCLDGALRVWLIRTDRPESPLTGLPAAKANPLGDLYDVDRTWYLSGLMLVRFTLKPTGPDQVRVG
ncbi:glycosyltransferase family 39 protein [Catenuloplanes atrovinosus]|uniref:Mannosyltransferase n=1 Tax=Catenuloplanes atrovinosus TaxID=137266 RepID=A0AAE3YJT1_9ACTN|nr:glycosyltransferase family 39 protein [Catenuloplanes atrovinosus]MDR7273468.1 mannosyltransferase [Catenuloplanes atrovinosus]